MRIAFLPLLTLALIGCDGSDQNDDPNAMKTPLISLSFDDVRFAECIATEAVYNEIEFMEDLQHLNCTGWGISSVWGLEQLTNLKTLDLGYNQISDIDASNLSKLEKLNVEVNALTQIMLPDGERLTHLNLNENDLTTIDLTGLKELTEFTATHNPLTQINWRNDYAKLKEINISYTQLASMDLTVAPNLFSFAAVDSQLQSLISTTTTKLDTLRLFNTELDPELTHPEREAYVLGSQL
ncbi:leucine-rich repeat domain-containing protein [Vibrio sp. PNB22_3_1]